MLAGTSAGPTFFLPGPGPALTEPKLFISPATATTGPRLLLSLGVGK